MKNVYYYFYYRMYEFISKAGDFQLGFISYSNITVLEIANCITVFNYFRSPTLPQENTRIVIISISFFFKYVLQQEEELLQSVFFNMLICNVCHGAKICSA